MGIVIDLRGNGIAGGIGFLTLGPGRDLLGDIIGIGEFEGRVAIFLSGFFRPIAIVFEEIADIGAGVVLLGLTDIDPAFSDFLIVGKEVHAPIGIVKIEVNRGEGWAEIILHEGIA